MHSPHTYHQPKLSQGLSLDTSLELKEEKKVERFTTKGLRIWFKNLVFSPTQPHMPTITIVTSLWICTLIICPLEMLIDPKN